MAKKHADPVEVMQRSYEKGVTDEFIEPVTIVDERNQPVGLDSRRRRLHLFQLPRRPRTRDDGALTSTRSRRVRRT